MILNCRRLLKSTALGAIGATAPFVIRDLHAQEVVKIAGIHDASGGLDIYGKPMIAALTFAVEEINAAGGLLGRQVKLVTYDPQSNMQLYTQFAQQAAIKDKVAVVHGGITSASREVIRPMMNRFNTLYFYNTQYEGGVCDRNIFCTGSTPAQNVEKLVPYVDEEVGQEGLHRRGRLQLRPDHQRMGQEVRPGERRRVVATDFFPLDVTEFGPTIQKIQAAKPDLVMSALVGGAHISFYRQWAAAGMQKQIPMASTTFGGGNEHMRAVAGRSGRHDRLLQLLPGDRQPGQQGLPGALAQEVRRQGALLSASWPWRPIRACSCGPRASRRPAASTA